MLFLFCLMMLLLAAVMVVKLYDSFSDGKSLHRPTPRTKIQA